MQFDLPKEQASIIKVIGVGGGGSNAVNHMFNEGIRGVNFVICNTDGQAMELSPIPNKIQLGPHLTEGLGAGSNPEIGKLATEESMEDVKDLLEKNTKMVFVTAGMGGGTGTGGAPVIARLAKEMDILTVGIVTLPFAFEGRRKLLQAQKGIEELRENVDSLIVISNDKIREIYGNLTRSDAFSRADNILAIAARSISEIITVAGQINVDFADVEYVMKKSGVAIMGSATAEGEDRAAKAIQSALSSPLLNDNNISGAQKILLNITSGSREVLIDEINEIHEYVLDAVGADVDVIFGTCDDENLGDKLCVTVIATGFDNTIITQAGNAKESNRVVLNLEESAKKEPLVELKEEPVKKPSTELSFDFEIKNTEKLETSSQPKQEEAEQPKMETPKEEEKTTEEYFTLDWGTPVPEEPKEEKEEQKSQEDGFRLINREQTAEQRPFIRSTVQADSTKDERGEMDLISSERLKRLRSMNLKINNPSSLNELESQPAFKRRNIQLNSMPHSSEMNMSRLTLSEDEEDAEKTEIRRNNSFLHDNVD